MRALSRLNMVVRIAYHKLVQSLRVPLRSAKRLAMLPQYHADTVKVGTDILLRITNCKSMLSRVFASIVAIVGVYVVARGYAAVLS